MAWTNPIVDKFLSETVFKPLVEKIIPPKPARSTGK